MFPYPFLVATEIQLAAMAARDKTDVFLKDKTENGNPREQEALEYIKKHKIMELFDNFTAQMLFSRPCEFVSLLVWCRVK